MAKKKVTKVTSIEKLNKKSKKGKNQNKKQINEEKNKIIPNKKNEKIKKKSGGKRKSKKSSLKSKKGNKKTSKKATDNVKKNENINMQIDDESNNNNNNSNIIDSEQRENKNVELNKNTTTMISKNGAIVDIYIKGPENYHVVPAKPSQYHNTFYSCTLNYSNIAKNNNKFYIIQLLQNEINLKYYIFLRWGRVGRIGQTNLLQFDKIEDGIEFYMNKYLSKIEYGYVELKLNYEEEKNINSNDIEEVNSSKLNPKVRELIRILFDMNSIDEQMKEIGYDTTRMPLGKLSKENLNEGMDILIKIENVINNKDKGNLNELCSKFYTLIPHNFGFHHMTYFKISTLEEVKEKIDLLESLKDINVISKVIETEKKTKVNTSLESFYNSLKCEIKPIDTDKPIYDILNNYLLASTTLPSAPKLTLLDIFELKRESELNNNESKKNPLLLWYGTRTSNYVSLITDGFRLPSPESPPSAYTFGKGIYFSDMSIKVATTRCFSNRIGYLMLCEVDLGNIEERTSGDYNLPQSLKAGMDSVKVCGMNCPEASTYYIEPNTNVTIPIGNPAKSNIKVRYFFILSYIDFFWI